MEEGDDGDLGDGSHYVRLHRFTRMFVNIYEYL